MINVNPVIKSKTIRLILSGDSRSFVCIRSSNLHRHIMLAGTNSGAIIPAIVIS